jgi:tRNA(Arg) A34 adenosine deaminase TadA
MCLAAILWSRLDGVMYAATCDDAAAVGFDDRVFHEELRRPPGERRLPVVQALRVEALVPLREWGRKTDRIPY